MLQVKTFILGPLENNSYLLHDPATHDALLIDPSFEPGEIYQFILDQQLNLKMILITHAHFDHYYGLPYLQKMLSQASEVYLHPDDLDIWRSGGQAKAVMGNSLSMPDPKNLLDPDESYALGDHSFSVLFTPGHTPGSVSFYFPELKSIFVGDLIFFHGIGRTDFPGGDYDQLIHSIQTQIFTLPDETTIYPGHDSATTVGEEKLNNPL